MKQPILEPTLSRLTRGLMITTSISILVFVAFHAYTVSDANAQAPASQVSARSSTLGASLADRKVGVINQLRWLNRSLRELRLKVNPKLPLNQDELTRALQEAELGQLSGQALGVSTQSAMTLSRDSISRLTSYPQLVMTYGSALSELGLDRSALAQLKRVIQNDKVTPRQLERAMIALFDRGRGQLKPQELLKVWARYLRRCQRFKRPPSSAARYMFAKALYFAEDHQRAERELKIVEGQRGYRARALYIRAVILLVRGELEGAFKLFMSLKSELDQVTARARPPHSDQAAQDDQQPTLIHQRVRLRVTQVQESPQASTATAQRQDEGAGGRGRALPDDLRALLDEVNREEQLLRGSSEPKRALGVPPPVEEGILIEQMRSVFALALARIALLRGDEALSWQLYREVSIGSPSYSESLIEVAYALQVRKEYKRCASVLRQALLEYPSGEASLNLKLWRAEMLARSGQTRRVDVIYNALKRELKRQEDVLTNAARSKVFFAPEVLAWLPSEVAVSGRRFSRSLRELELWVTQARRDLKALSEASKTRRYSALDLGDQITAQVLEQLNRLEARLPELSRRWRGEAQAADQGSEQGSEVRVQVNRGAQLNASAVASFSASQVSASVRQLKRRALTIRDELKRRRERYDARLSGVIKREASQLKQRSLRLKQLKALIQAQSVAAQKLALDRVRQAQGRLTLGPILRRYWIKEAASDALERARDQRIEELTPLNAIQDQDRGAPKTLNVLDILGPQVIDYIRDPLPDPDRDR